MSITRRAQLKSTLNHEVGHAIAFAAFGIPINHIEIDADGNYGCVYGGDDKHLTKRQQNIINIAGLAGERIDNPSPGVVLTYTEKSKNHIVVNAPKSIRGEDGDLALIYEVGFEHRKFGAEDEYLNGILKEAWNILQANKALFKELVQHLQNPFVGTQEEDDGRNPWVQWSFEPKDYQHIVRKVRPATKKSRRP